MWAIILTLCFPSPTWYELLVVPTDSIVPIHMTCRHLRYSTPSEFPANWLNSRSWWHQVLQGTNIVRTMPWHVIRPNQNKAASNQNLIMTKQYLIRCKQTNQDPAHSLDQSSCVRGTPQKALCGFEERPVSKHLESYLLPAPKQPGYEWSDKQQNAAMNPSKISA